jgi:hypothetical protein
MNLAEKVDIITEKVINELYNLNHNYEISPDTINTKYVYHCARSSNSDSDGYKAIFKFGFERFFVNKGAGNYYGPGVYTTIDLASSIVNAHKNIYGNVIIKAEIISYDKYIIWHPVLAKKVYGDKWRLRDQFNLLIPEAAEILKKERPDTYRYLTEPSPGRTADLARTFWELCSYGILRNTNAYDNIHGLVFIGYNDGHVAVVKDVKNLIPLEYSLDYGKTWVNGQTEKTIRYTKNDFDSAYHFGKKYDKTYPPEFGLAKVEKKGKFNYIDKTGNEFSPIWFDAASDFNKIIGIEEPVSEVIINNSKYFLLKDGQVYEDLENDDYPLCTIDELPQYI